MAKHWPLLVTLLLAPLARAQEFPELSAIAFRAAPLTSDARPGTSGVPALGASRVTPLSGAAPVRRVVSIADADDLSAAIDKQLAAITEEEAREGERSPTLIDPLQSLAALYEEAGKHDAAIATLQQAIWILRVNSGLFSLDQVDAVESLMAVRKAKGEHDQAATLQGYLQQLATRNPEDRRVASLMARLADAEMASARELLDTPPPPQFTVTNFNDVLPHPTIVRSPALRALLAARRHYAAAILAGVHNHTESLAELVSLEDRLIDTLYFDLAHPKLRYYEDGPSPIVGLGERMLRSKITHTVELNQSPAARAKALIELGDWYLFFHINGPALEQYKAAHDLLLAEGVSQSSIDEIVPADMPPLLAAAQDTATHLTHHGYVDATVELGPYGNARSIDVLGTSPDTPKVVEKRLRQYIEKNRFRPRFVDGQLARSDKFDARFYYDY